MFALLIAGLFVFVGTGYCLRRLLRNNAQGRQPLYSPLLDESGSAPSLLLLGPSGVGKTTLFRAALALAGEPPTAT